MPRPPPGAGPSQFQELLGRLSEEHALLARRVDGLARENRELRRLMKPGAPREPDALQLPPGLSPGDGTPQGSSAPLQSRQLVEGSSCWGAKLAVQLPHGMDGLCQPSDPDGIASMSPRTMARMLSVPARCRVNGHLGYTTEAYREEEPEGDGNHLRKSQRKLQKSFNLPEGKESVSTDHVCDLLRRHGALKRYHVPLVKDLFMKLGACVPRKRVPFSKTMTARPLEIPLFKFTELMSAEDVKAVIPGCKPDVIILVELVRKLVFQEDAKMLILSALSIVDIHDCEPEESKFDRVMDIVMSFVIMANAFFIGWFAGSTVEGWNAQHVIEFIFTCIFFAEQCLKVWRHGLRQHCLGRDAMWNMFDMGIVTLGIVDFVMTFNLAMNDKFNPATLMILRMVRFLRIGRLIRVIRVSIFREMKLMINGIFGLLKTLSCAIVILLLTVYILAICLVQVLGGVSGDGSGGPTITGQALLFASVPRSMFTVFRCLLIGDCTTIDGTPISMHLNESIGWTYAVTFSTCCVLMHYGLGSLITALVVDATLNEAKKAEFRNSLKSEQKSKIARQLHKLALSFEYAQREMDGVDHDPEKPSATSVLFMSRETFSVVCQRKEVMAMMDEIDIDEADRLDLFDALDVDGNGRIELDELIEGLVKMRGKVRKADMVASRLMLNQMMGRITRLETEVFSNHRQLLEILDSMAQGIMAPAMR